jgi:hypothetical protein
MKLIAFAVMALLAGSAARADIDIALYHQAQREGGSSWDAMQYYINGVADGIMIVNARVTQETGKPLICFPETLPLGLGNWLGLIDQAAKHYPAEKFEHLMVSAVLQQALENTFPCKAAH